MKTSATGVISLLFLFCYVECRKTYVPIDKNANLAFINMEGGGGVRPAGNAKPVSPTPAPAAAPAAGGKPSVTPTSAKPSAPPVQQTTVKPPAVPPTPAKPVVTPAAPAKPSPPQIQPKPVNPTPASKPITTPGPGSVKQLINFYDSQGKASPIRPYSYSQAVKQG